MLKTRQATRTALAILPARLQRLVRSIHRAWPRSHPIRFSADLRKPVPLWSLLIILLLGSFSGIAAYSGLIQIAAESQAQISPDFTIGSSPVSLSMSQGSLATVNIELGSLEGFAGSVSLAANMTPAAQGSSIALNPTTISLFTGSGTSQLTISANLSTPTGSYTLTVNGTSGRLSHSVITLLTIMPPPPPDFSISANPQSLTVKSGSSAVATILVTSLYGFTGNVTLTVTVTPVVGNGPTATLNPVVVMLSSNGTQGSTLVVNTVNNTPRATYTILVVGTSGSISHSLGIVLTVQ